MTAFSSGFGTRVDVSAPSDNIPALQHTCLQFGSCTASDAVTVLDGGTSVSTPMTAAAVADLLQVGKATGHPLTPRAVRRLLEQTGRDVATQPQVDRQLSVGPQIDITRAVEALLGSAPSAPAIVRLSTAHRVTIGDANANFVESTDPGAIDLTGPVDGLGNPTGESLVGPITFGPTDGTLAMAPAPVVAPVTPVGQPVSVRYDITGVTGVRQPELIISSINHWSPFAAPMYRIAYSAPLIGPTGTITVPASVFAAGGGVYGAAVMQDSVIHAVGAVVPFRIDGGGPDQRPDAPTLAPVGGTPGHQATVTRAAPNLQVSWDVGSCRVPPARRWRSRRPARRSTGCSTRSPISSAPPATPTAWTVPRRPRRPCPAAPVPPPSI
jgi:hypothetical protein